MPRRLAVAPRLDPDELRRRARAAPAADRVRWLAGRLVSEGRPATEVGPLVGFSPEWVRALVRRYSAGDPAALGDGRRGNAGGHRCWTGRPRMRCARRWPGSPPAAAPGPAGPWPHG
ncbi:MAG: hypothetical protein AVDCRST_MAG59-772 [uncultured Thermomicrobiales bacterium]|uniref:Uncharacterized protein n=1 Tax=uncultured Thermomicrobiales bacterium TaxID=1645740 RepID=A0A6J4U6Z2_9BACT|nr:MAG: hypothetical protein AVDCRST_MAG59-772 [uncultured Thermomicrobiales bacterium]